MFFARIVAAVSLACLLPFAAFAETSDATAPANTAITNPSAPVSRGELPELVKQAILNNPDIIMQAIEKIRAKQVQQSSNDVKAALKKHSAELFDDKSSPSIGPKNADVTLVEFFDYHCGYCKQLLPSIVKLTQEDKNVRIVFRDFPILSEDSVTAARAALAVNRIDPKKYFDYYVALMKTPGRFDQETLLATAQKVGINPDKLKAALNDPDNTAELDKNRSIAEDLGIRGTPALVIDNRVIPGALSYDELQKVIEQARADNKKAANKG